MLILSKTTTYTTIILTISLCVGDYYIETPGFSIYQKLLLLISTIIYTSYFGIDRTKIWPYFFFSIAIFTSFAMALALGERPSTSALLTSFISMSTGFILFSSRISMKLSDRIIPALITLPFISTLAGFLLFPALGKLPWLIEHTGAFRLSGALHPAHLAMLCVIALMACCIYPFRNETQRLTLVFLLILLLLLTGARGALLAAFIAIFPLSQSLYRKNTFLLLSLCGLISSPIFFKLAENIILRTITGNEVFNTSGRSGAWNYFIEKSSGTEFFGKGFGSATSLTEGITQNNLNAFVVPHNEYIRFYYDIGFIGSIILFFGIFGYLFARSLSYQANRAFAICFTLSFAVYSFVDNTFGTPHFIICFFIIFSALDIRSRRSKPA